MTDMNEIESNRQNLQQQVKRIRSNPDLTDEAKKRMIGEAHAKSMQKHQELVAQHEETQQRAIKDLEKQVFKVYAPARATAAEKEAHRVSFRDALSRAESAAESADVNDRPHVLEGLLARAERQEDRLQAEAIYHLARERGYQGVTDAYLKDRPYERETWERYQSLKKQAEDPTVRIFGYLPPLKPEELR
jgi:hypothetical protein